MSSNHPLQPVVRAPGEGQVFNVLGRDNMGGVGSGWVTNALSDAFGRLRAAQDNRQAELAARFIF